nr:cell wall-binding repeat-containing protein [Actinomycetota bacterium]
GDAEPVSLEPAPYVPEDPILIEGFAVTQGSMEEGGCMLLERAPETTLRDLVISEGNARIGGGIFARYTDLVIEDCEFTHNGFWPMELEIGAAYVQPAEIVRGEVSAAAGGAVLAMDSSVSMKNTVFSGNAAESFGGAIYAQSVDMYSEDCVAEGNYLTGEGFMLHSTVSPAEQSFANGGFAHLTDSDVTFDSLVAEANVAVVGGAISSDSFSNISFTDSSFTDNVAFVGGAIYRGFSFGMGLLPPEPQDSIDLGIRSISPVLVEAEPAHYEQCVFSGNTALLAGVILDELSVHVTDSLFVGNSDGLATLIVGNQSVVDGSTFADNTTGAGVLLSGVSLGASATFEPAFEISSSTITNSIVWDNVLDMSEDLEVPPGWTQGYPVQGFLTAYSDIQASEVQPVIAQSALESTQCISVDPMFTDPDNGDYRLDEGSPCIDTGTWETESYMDLDGLLRPVDGDLDGSEDFDMGAYESAGPRMARLAGETRYDTSARVSASRFTSSDTVVIATGRVFADGLSSAGLAGAYDAPLLLTGSDYLPTVIAAEIERLGATSAILIGGTVAVEDVVKADLEAMGLEVSRIGGGDRYETAALVAEEIRSVMGEDMSDIAFVARGDQYPDALAVSPVAYAMGAPILLVRPDQLPESTVDVIAEMGIMSVVVAGGSNAVGVSVAGEIAEAGATIERISGSDRYETAAMFAQYAVDQEWASFTVTGLSTGASFPDALSGGAALGHVNGVMLLTPSDTLSSFAADVLETNAEKIIYLRTLGGFAAVSAAVQAEAEALVE